MGHASLFVAATNTSTLTVRLSGTQSMKAKADALPNAKPLVVQPRVCLNWHSFRRGLNGENVRNQLVNTSSATARP
jgi:hypothetical protein